MIIPAATVTSGLHPNDSITSTELLTRPLFPPQAPGTLKAVSRPYDVTYS